MAGTQVISVGDAVLTFATPQWLLRQLELAGAAWFAPDPPQSLWELTAVDAEGRRANLTATAAKRVERRTSRARVVVRWCDVRDPKTGAGPFTVELEISVGTTPGATAWRVRVDNLSTTWTLWQVEAPCWAGLRRPAADGDVSLYHPEGWGTESRGWTSLPTLDRWCPRGWDFAMPWLALRRGRRVLYLGAHDPEQQPRQFRLRFAPERASATLALGQYPEGMTLPGNSFRQSGDIVLAAVTGDWFDAAPVYAAWARPQPWVTAPPPGAKPRQPENEVHAWHRISLEQGDPATHARQAERLAARLPVRLGVHLYNWHQTPFDMNYPDYFPARPAMREFIARLQAAGYLAMPYINARLWDINAASWTARHAERWAAKNSALRVHPRTLVPYLEEYGSGQKLAPMCPATAFWQDTVIELCRRITQELGAQGVYLDQVAAERATLCFDDSHGHALGGGGYWLSGYRRLMARLRVVVGPDVHLTTECNWDGCVADYDGLLMWHSYNANLVPLFAAVYGGLARTFGCNFGDRDITEHQGEGFARRMGMLFVWGCQLGWGDLTPLLAPGRERLLAYFASLCQYRQEHAATFAHGRFLRPPTLAFGRAAPVARLDVTRDPVLGSLWQGADGGVTLFLANPTTAAATATVQLTAAECAGRRLEGKRAGGRQATARVEMGPLSVRALRVG